MVGTPRKALHNGAMSGETRGQWFANAMAAISGRLPFGLSAVVPPNVVGYLLINGCTFGLDLALLTTFHGGVALPPSPTGRARAVLTTPRRPHSPPLLKF